MKQCTNCQAYMADTATHCSECGRQLPSRIAYYESSSRTGESQTWMFVLAVLIPIVGFILGCIQLGKSDTDTGKKLIIVSIIVPVAIYLLYCMVTGLGIV